MRVNYAIVFVSDMARAVSFYRDIVRLPLHFESPGWTEFTTDGAKLALHGGTGSSAGDPHLHAAGSCRPGFNVPSLDEFHARMLQHGVRCTREPGEIFGARIAQYVDPDGLEFSVSETLRHTRRHVHEESFPASPERMFTLLYTPSAIRQWWGASRAIVLPERGGVWAATWGESEDDPDYVTMATIREFEPPSRLVLSDYRYRARSGPLPFRADFVTEFLVAPHPDGSTLRVCQDGFPAGPEADEFYAACGDGWRNTFRGIRRFLGDFPDSSARVARSHVNS